MANVAVSIAMDPTYLPFERPPDRAALWTSIPRGLRGFVVESGTLAAKPDSDTETLLLHGILPPSFAYVLCAISLRLSQDVADDWRNEYTLNLANFYQGHLAVSSDWNFPFLGSAGGVAAATTRGNSVSSTDNLPRAPMWSPSMSTGIQVNITTANVQTAVGAAGTIAAYINFWEFDLEQARKYPINSPLPIHAR